MNCPAEVRPAAPKPNAAAAGTDTGAASAASPAAAGATIYGIEPPRVSLNFRNGSSVQPFSVGVKRASARFCAASYSRWASATSLTPSLPLSSSNSPPRRSNPAAAAAVNPVVSCFGLGSAGRAKASGYICLATANACSGDSPSLTGKKAPLGSWIFCAIQTFKL